MSSFTKPLTVTKLKSGLWKVSVGFKYHVGKKNSKDVVSVPTGFKTDFASVPRLLWCIFPPDGQYTQSAVLHDFLYSKRERKRLECDRIFLESMEVLEVSWWRRRTIFRAVRLFGWLPWKKRRN